MLPKTVSASALRVAELCPARYKAEMIDKASNFRGIAANLGIVLHHVLEKFILGFKIRKDTPWDINLVLAMYDEAFQKYFGSDRTIPEYKEGRSILVGWFNRDSTFEKIVGTQVLSVESKNSFPVRVEDTNGNRIEIPFNYIFDRLDRIGPGEYRVVDYKSQRIPYSDDEIRGNIQARAYAVAVATKYKDAQKIWVEFDFLRHDSVGVLFTRDDNVATYRQIQRSVQAIINTPDDRAPEKLNEDCIYCVRKPSCKALRSNVAAGGSLSLSTDEKAVLLYEINGQVKALEALANEIERDLLLQANHNDTLQFETDNATIKVTSSSRRKVDTSKVAEIVGPEIMAEYAGLGVGDFDTILKRPDLTDAQRAALKTAVSKSTGSPRIKVVLKK